MVFSRFYSLVLCFWTVHIWSSRKREFCCCNDKLACELFGCNYLRIFDGKFSCFSFFFIFLAETFALKSASFLILILVVSCKKYLYVVKNFDHSFVVLFSSFFSSSQVIFSNCISVSFLVFIIEINGENNYTSISASFDAVFILGFRCTSCILHRVYLHICSGNERSYSGRSLRRIQKREIAIFQERKFLNFLNKFFVLFLFSVLCCVYFSQ